MSFNNWINERIILPLDDKLFNRPVNKYFNFLQKSQWWSEDRLNEYQNEKLRLLINHAYSNVPYYNETFKKLKLTPEDIKTKADLYKLPLLTKEIIRENFPNKLVAANIPKKNIVLSGSSGSTGQPLQYYRSVEALSFSRACNLRGWYWMGFRLGDPYMKISTIARASLYKKLQDKINNSYHVHSKSMTHEDILKMINVIRKSNVKFLRGYPASLYIIAKYLNENGIDDIYLTAVNTTSEPLYPNMRALIEKMFHCHVFDSYSAEGSAVISQCEHHDLYHIASEKAITEFQRNGELVESGKAKMIFTDLTNFVTPFIRYDVKDYVQISPSKCKCGRNLPSVEKIEGRDTDILITPSGKFITFYFFAGYFEHQNYIDMFQMKQDTISDFTLKIVINENFTSEMEKKIYADILEVMGKDVKLNIEVVDDIPLTTSGKRRFFIRDQKVSLSL
jgi:phenylacetate-CoA ligase